MGEMVEHLIAGGVIFLVGGAIIGMVLKLTLGGRKEDAAIADIAAKYGSTKNKKAKR